MEFLMGVLVGFGIVTAAGLAIWFIAAARDYPRDGE